jgi:hypothetical protein
MTRMVRIFQVQILLGLPAVPPCQEVQRTGRARAPPPRQYESESHDDRTAREIRPGGPGPKQSAHDKTHHNKSASESEA